MSLSTVDDELSSPVCNSSRAPPQKPVVCSAQRLLNRGVTCTYLILDGHVEANAATRETLKSVGHRVFSASNEAEAVAWLEANSLPCVILLDPLSLPMGPARVVNVLRARPAGNTIPVVVVSSCDGADCQSITRAFVKKPARREDLLATELYCEVHALNL